MFEGPEPVVRPADADRETRATGPPHFGFVRVDTASGRMLPVYVPVMPDDVTGISTLAEAQQTLASQPFSVLIGAQLVVYTRGRAELEIPLRPDLLQQFGFAHGGVLAYAADNALTFAAGTVLGPSIVTTGMTLDYLRPAKGPLLRAVATVLNGGRTQALCRCEIYSVDDDSVQKLCAAAQGGAHVIDLTR